MNRVEVAVVGAGPFGLSVASWLSDRDTRLFGEAMRTWRTQMPADMLMRSAWAETSISSPGEAGSIDAWAKASGEGRQEPIPLQAFLSYADWFRERFVRDHDPADVASLERSGTGFRLTTAAGEEVEARSVVLAVGVTPFPRAPAALMPHLGPDVTFAIEQQRSFAHLDGKRVVVVGAGQAGLESAGLAARAGAEVEVLARSGVRWFADREPHHERGRLESFLYRLAYPAVGYGPPPLNRVVLYPDLFAALPRDARGRLTERVLRPGGSPWVRELVEGNVTLTERVSVRSVERGESGIDLELSDGTHRHADTILLATGYRFSLDRLPFLSDEIRGSIVLDGDFPRLDRAFRSTVPGLLFVGYPAEGRFGPLSRFVLGTAFTSKRLAAGLRRP